MAQNHYKDFTQIIIFEFPYNTYVSKLLSNQAIATSQPLIPSTRLPGIMIRYFNIKIFQYTVAVTGNKINFLMDTSKR